MGFVHLEVHMLQCYYHIWCNRLACICPNTNVNHIFRCYHITRCHIIYQYPPWNKQDVTHKRIITGAAQNIRRARLYCPVFDYIKNAQEFMWQIYPPELRHWHYDTHMIAAKSPNCPDGNEITLDDIRGIKHWQNKTIKQSVKCKHRYLSPGSNDGNPTKSNSRVFFLQWKHINIEGFSDVLLVTWW